MHNQLDYPINFSDLEGKTGTPNNGPEQHQGRILERVVRRDRMGISEIARRLYVSRRTLYNWFETKELSLDIICKVGFVIGHDFSKEFPEEFAQKTNTTSGEVMAELQSTTDKPKDPIYYWMDRYIKLLEKFNELLSKDAKTKAETMILLICGSCFDLLSSTS